MSWAWTLRKLAASAFVTTHLAAVGLWNLPDCALKTTCAGWTSYYILPTGQWQQWGMFAPNPVRDTNALDGIVQDAKGMVRTYNFPRVADRTKWQAMCEFRQSKFLHNVNHPDNKAHREYAARYVTRKLGLGRDDFPAIVQLVYRTWITPPPGSPPPDPTGPADTVSVIETYRFPTFEETLP